jgi:hypothetical protein
MLLLNDSDAMSACKGWVLRQVLHPDQPTTRNVGRRGGRRRRSADIEEKPGIKVLETWKATEIDAAVEVPDARRDEEISCS